MLTECDPECSRPLERQWGPSGSQERWSWVGLLAPPLSSSVSKVGIRQIPSSEQCEREMRGQ